MFVEITPSSWKEAKDIGSLLSTWIFRGHSDNNWRLLTTIERAARQFNCSRNLIWIREKMLTHEFRNRAHHYIQSPPEPTELLEWLALVQHYGGPTRLLDFTDSFYVASFFAVEAAFGDSCVWAINNIELLIKIEEHIGKLLDFPTKTEFEEAVVRFSESFLMDRGKSLDFVVSVKPVRLNERISIHKGVFLFPCNIKKSFEHNLCATFKFPFSSLRSKNARQVSISKFDDDLALDASIVKINLPRKLQYDAYLDLYSMNLDAASLFPGLDGFSRSLKYHLIVMGGLGDEKRERVRKKNG